MIPPRLSFIVSSDLRDLRGRILPALLLRTNPAKNSSNFGLFFGGKCWFFTKANTPACNIFTFFLLLLFEYYFKYLLYVLDICNIYVHASIGKLLRDLKDNSQL